MATDISWSEFDKQKFRLGVESHEGLIAKEPRLESDYKDFFSSEELDISDMSYINSEDREQLKTKISDLISKIDHHLRT